MNATTVWEHWEYMNGAGMNSHAHPAHASVGAWFYRWVAGLRLDDGTLSKPSTGYGKGWRQVRSPPAASPTLGCRRPRLSGHAVRPAGCQLGQRHRLPQALRLAVNLVSPSTRALETPARPCIFNIFNIFPKPSLVLFLPSFFVVCRLAHSCDCVALSPAQALGRHRHRRNPIRRGWGRQLGHRHRRPHDGLERRQGGGLPELRRPRRCDRRWRSRAHGRQRHLRVCRQVEPTGADRGLGIGRAERQHRGIIARLRVGCPLARSQNAAGQPRNFRRRWKE